MKEIEEFKAEIERLEKKYEKEIDFAYSGDYWDGYNACLTDMKKFVNRLAGKEVYEIEEEKVLF